MLKPRIDPTRHSTSPVKPDGSPDDNDRGETGPTALAFSEWQHAGIKAPNLEMMRQFRLDRIVKQIQSADIAGLLMFDPLNIRYATDSSNMQVFASHSLCRACFISAEGYVILWDFKNCDHISGHLPLIKEVRHGASFYFFESGDRINEHASIFASTIADIVTEHGAGNKRIAVDRIEIVGLRALEAEGLTVIPGTGICEKARSIKGPDDISAIRCAMHAAEQAVSAMEKTVEPGLSEAEIWSVLHREQIRRGGEWIECRLLASGPRTNPWYQECGPRIVQSGDLLAFDTDLVSCYGMCIDFSRTWLVGDGKATAEQKDLYQIAQEHLEHNISLLQPGADFKEISDKSHRLPEACRPLRYAMLAHGVGMCDEYPCIYYPEDYETHGLEGQVEVGMTLCAEAYVGKLHGHEGVKLEQQVLITENGPEILSLYPFDQRLSVPI